MSDVYIYKYFFNNNTQILSSWMKFELKGAVRSLKFNESKLNVVSVYNGQVMLEVINLEEGYIDEEGYNTNLDKRIKVTVEEGYSDIQLPYIPHADDDIEVYTVNGLKLNSTRQGSVVTLSQPVTEDTECYLGIPYTMKYTFSEQVFKAKSGKGVSPSNAAKMKIRNGSIFYDDTSYFKVKVTPKYRDTYENVFTPDIVGSTTIGNLNLDSGCYRFPVFTGPEDTTITIENDSALPSNFQSAEFESFVHSRSERYA